MKKGYFFLLDGIFAVIILIVGFIVISTTKFSDSYEVPMSNEAENVMNLFSEVRIKDICKNMTANNCECINVELERYCNESLIINKDNNLLDMFGELYYTNHRSEAEDIFRNISYEYRLGRPEVFDVDFIIDNRTIYSMSTEHKKEMISSRKISFGYTENIDTGEVNFWGPYLIEVRISQK